MHARRLNGILADEMGLGKTVQAIALLAHLACARGIWGPHLVVAPTSCLVNWEAELKKFCPGLKIVTYYGSAKTRKTLRTGWSKAGALHVCVTSYQLAVQDASVFRRKKFYYLILDEAHNIKNFESRRWRTLLAFQAQRRLLLTGTPLQNSLMELWSLMHFLMPHLFRSRQEFSYWFSNPLSSAVEGRSRVSDELVKRLHSIMRPFVLRRLKKDVAKQLPAKHEHEVLCKLSRRQQLLYEEFMSRSSTRKAFAKESNVNFVSMMNVVMQLRKVCNHPDLFEPRPIIAPFLFTPGVELSVPRCTIVDSMREAPQWLRVDDNVAVRETPMASLDLVLGPRLFVEDMNAPYDQLRMRLDEEATDTLRRMHRQRTLSTAIGASSLTLRAIRVASALLKRQPLRLASLAVSFWGDEDNAETEKIALVRNRARRLASRLLTEMLEASSLPRRVESMQDVLSRFVFVVPRAVAAPVVLCVRGIKRHRASIEAMLPHGVTKDFAANLGRRLSKHLRPVELAQLVNFPDRSLVQWDSGKFHKLAPLLRELKSKDHRCLIFTQMSRMLDVLEAFLCFHGHSYSRLDGSTAPDERQRRVERFNSDESLFCMILSTRSGGLGINLTGADVVIFYDSDWNPAMDAQATDRAHRIGQTREVHIYRLVCTSTVEENILVKAKQKRKLEFVALTEGQFDAAGIVARMVSTQNVADLTVQVEDAEDVEFARKAQQEEANEAAEFSETAVAQEAADEGDVSAVDAADETAKLEAEFAAWQERVGPDADKLADALKPVERRCLELRGELLADSVAGASATSLMTASERKLWEEMTQGKEDDDVDVDAIEEEKQADEHKACVEGDILVSDVYFDNSAASAYERAFKRRRRKMHAEAARRKVTGAAWERRHDVNTGEPFWYNVDTEEATWRTPSVIARRDAEIDARLSGYGKLALEIAVRILTCVTHVDRARVAAASRRWARAARHDCFITIVLPVERLAVLSSSSSGQGAAATVKSSAELATLVRKRRRHESTDDASPPMPEDLMAAPTHASLRAAIANASCCETLSLSPGHYWEDADDLLVDKSIRIIGDIDEPARVVVELGGALRWRAASGTIAGLTLRRPRTSKTATAALVVDQMAKLCASRLFVDNDGAGGAALVVATNGFAYMNSCRVAGARGSGVVVRGSAALERCALLANRSAGLFLQHGAAALISDSWLGPNDDAAVQALAGSALALEHCDCSKAPVRLEDDPFFLSTNTLGVRDTTFTLQDFLQECTDQCDIRVDMPMSPRKRVRDTDDVTDGTARSVEYIKVESDDFDHRSTRHDDNNDMTSVAPLATLNNDRSSKNRARPRQRHKETQETVIFAPNVDGENGGDKKVVAEAVALSGDDQTLSLTIRMGT